MAQQRTLARGTNAGDFLQSGFADVAPPPDAMRAHREAMRLVAQPLHEIEHRIARLELERLASREKEGLEPGIALRPLGDGDKRQIDDAEGGERLQRGAELSPPAVDNDEVGPR